MVRVILRSLSKSLKRSLSYIGWFLLPIALSYSLSVALPSGAEPNAVPNPMAALVQQGRDAYQAGRYNDAIAPLQQAVQTYSTTNAPLNQALALSYLALTYQELGDRPQAESTIHSSVTLLSSALPSSKTKSQSVDQVNAQVFSTLGELQFAWGQVERAVDSWQTAANHYQELNDRAGMLGTQVNQIQALRTLGHYRQTEHRTERLSDQLKTLGDSEVALVGWRSLGNTQYAMGDFEAAQASLDHSLTIAEHLSANLGQGTVQVEPFDQEIADALLSLGNLNRTLGDRQLNQKRLSRNQSLVQQSSCPNRTSRGLNLNDIDLSHYQAAARYYQSAIDQQASLANQVRSRLNQLDLTLALNQRPAELELKILRQALEQLPSSRFAIYANIRFAFNLTCIPHQYRGVEHKSQRPKAILKQTIRDAQALGDKRAESYAWGSLGRLHEDQQKRLTDNARKDAIAQAQADTQTAMVLAQGLQAPDLFYRWHWQMGRLLKEEDRRDDAIKQYTLAFNTLKTLRADLTVLDTDIQFSFREQVEPLYRQFAELLLRSPDAPSLRQARDVLEALQLAELDNFFQDACSPISPESLDTIIDEQDRTSAVLYSIILPDRLDIVLKLPRSLTHPTSEPSADASPDLFHYSNLVSSQVVMNTVTDFRRKVTRPYGKEFSPSGQTLYRWLIKPVETQLQKQGIDHIVFVLDGVLRNVSIPALSDGKQYLADQYSISLAPGLQLLQSNRQTRQTAAMLAAGLSEGRPGFDPLPNVETELAAIAATIPSATQLLNQDFTQLKIETALQDDPISIVHFATHGQFSSQAEKTFILTHDGTINVNELYDLLRRQNDEDIEQAIDLLVLSACQTAKGDERAALGLAGVAVRAGARSTLASLWTVNDEATALLVTAFYRNLHNAGQGMSKAKALQLAQQTVRSFERDGDHPYELPRYWAAFVLLGNWF